MKKILTSIALVILPGSAAAVAPNVDDGLNWPEGASADNTASQQLQAEKTSGFNWKEDHSTVMSIPVAMQKLLME